MERSSLNFRFFKYNTILAAMILLVSLVSTYFIIGEIVEKEIGERALGVAQVAAKHPDIIEGLKQPQTSAEIQKLHCKFSKVLMPNMWSLGMKRKSGMPTQ